MQISKTDAIAFNGTFSMNAKDAVMGRCMGNTIKNIGKDIHVVNHEGEKCVTYIVTNGLFDDAIRKLLRKNDIQYLYYPSLNLAHGLKQYNAISKAIEESVIPPTSLEISKNSIRQAEKFEIMNRILKSLGVVMDAPKINYVDGNFLFEDGKTATKAAVVNAPRSANYFVTLVKTDSVDAETKFYKVKDQGVGSTPYVKKYDTPDGILQYRKERKAALKELPYNTKIFRGNVTACMNFELLADNVDLFEIEKRDMIENATKVVPDLTRKICSAPGFSFNPYYGLVLAKAKPEQQEEILNIFSEFKTLRGRDYNQKLCKKLCNVVGFKY